MGYEDDTKYFDGTQILKRKCNCGHIQKVYFDKAVCDWCGKYIFKEEKEAFKYKLKQKMKEGKTEMEVDIKNIQKDEIENCELCSEPINLCTEEYICDYDEIYGKGKAHLDCWHDAQESRL